LQEGERFFNPSEALLKRRFIIFCIMMMTLASCGALADSFRIEKWPERVPTPNLRARAINGQPLDLSGLRGKVVLLNYWASWCEPCVNEFAALETLSQGEAAGRGLVVIGVNFRESIAQISDFQSRHPASFPIYADRAGEYFKQWTRGVLPTTVLIGRDGRARWRITGELDTKSVKFTKALEQLLREAVPTDGSSGIVVK
jgi:thiol-disulfide isomerase/thioredoxin